MLLVLTNIYDTQGVLYDNMFGICMKLVRFIKMCLNETSCKFCKVWIGKCFSDRFPIQNV